MGISEKWSRENLAWAAGIFEGEGCISVSTKGRRRLKLSVSMTDRDVIEKLSRIIGLGSIGGPYTKVGLKDNWQWQVTSSEDVQAVLAAFWEFLCSRRKAKAVEAIKLASQVKNKDSIWCLRGHRLEGDNLYITKRGSRLCLVCNRMRSRETYKKNKNHVALELFKSPDCVS